MNEDQNKDGKDPKLLDHEYDGIREFDNPMPRWWLYIFWGTILWSVLYWFNVPGFGVGRGRIANYEQSVAQAKEQYGDLGAAVAAMGADEILAALDDQTRLDAGKEVFTSNCVPCHKPDGGGSIGPNLTDAYWIHGNTPRDMLETVSEGVLEKGMPAWNALLQPQEIVNVIAYTMTLRGTNPPGAKGPEGVNADSLDALQQTESGDQ